MNRSRKNSIYFLLRTTIVLILVGIFIWKINAKLLLSYFNFQVIKNILLVQPIIFLSLLMAMIRFLLLLGKPTPRFPFAFKAILLSYGLNNILPGRISELLKVSYLKEHVQLPIAVGLAAVLLERMMDILFLGFLALLSMWIFIGGSATQPLIILAVAFLGILVLLPRSENWGKWVGARIPWKFLSLGLEDVTKHTSSRLREGSFLTALPFGLASWFLSFLSVALFLQLNGVSSMGLLGALAVFTGVTVGVAVPLLPGGFGTYETGAVFVLEHLGYSLEKAFSIAIALHTSQILLCVVGSLIVSFTERVGILTLLKQGKALVQGKS